MRPRRTYSRASPNPADREDCRLCELCFLKRTHWSTWRYQASAPRTNLHDVPEEVYRRLGSQGHHWDLSSGGEGSAWTEEAGKLPGTCFELVKGEPQEEEHLQWTESKWCHRFQTGTSEPWSCKRWVDKYIHLILSTWPWYFSSKGLRHPMFSLRIIPKDRIVNI